MTRRAVNMLIESGSSRTTHAAALVMKPRLTFDLLRAKHDDHQTGTAKIIT
jgi:hypothetical protein